MYMTPRDSEAAVRVAVASWRVGSDLESAFDPSEEEWEKTTPFHAHALAEEMANLREVQLLLTDETGEEKALTEWIDSLFTWYLDRIVDPNDQRSMQIDETDWPINVTSFNNLSNPCASSNSGRFRRCGRLISLSRATNPSSISITAVSVSKITATRCCVVKPWSICIIEDFLWFQRST